MACCSNGLDTFVALAYYKLRAATHIRKVCNRATTMAPPKGPPLQPKPR
jgi:hypothetical protein